MLNAAKLQHDIAPGTLQKPVDGIVGVLRGPGGDGSRPCTFGSPDEASHLRGKLKSRRRNHFMFNPSAKIID